jgi:hypothetical protein
MSDNVAVSTTTPAMMEWVSGEPEKIGTHRREAIHHEAWIAFTRPHVL